ncbi:LIM/homeobox protein Lhx2-like [Palaemon carinicauda]|uniref:LIM/homeobox protein Lhx2-like n=1 Tax=Palaemon carinicauda TaxID=392227 RepID=UPI0035B62E82
MGLYEDTGSPQEMYWQYGSSEGAYDPSCDPSPTMPQLHDHAHAHENSSAHEQAPLTPSSSSSSSNSSASSGGHANFVSPCSDRTNHYVSPGSDAGSTGVGSPGTGISSGGVSSSVSGGEGSETSFCAGCSGRIIDRFYLLAVERKWHAGCLRCAACHSPLDAAVTCFARDGHIFCRDDYHRWNYLSLINFHWLELPLPHQPPLDGTTSPSSTSTGWNYLSLINLNWMELPLPHQLPLVGITSPSSTSTRWNYLSLINLNWVEVLLHQPHLSSQDASKGVYMDVDWEIIEPVRRVALASSSGSSARVVVFPPPLPTPPPPPLPTPPPPPPPPPHSSLFSYLWLHSTFSLISSTTTFASSSVSNPIPTTTRLWSSPSSRQWTASPAICYIPGGYDLESAYGPLGTPCQSVRTKRIRTSFKHHQLRTMKAYFALNHNPDAKDLKQLSQKTGLSKRVLQVWFQNARAKWRRQLMSKDPKALAGSGSEGGLEGQQGEGSVGDYPDTPTVPPSAMSPEEGNSSQMSYQQMF